PYTPEKSFSLNNPTTSSSCSLLPLKDSLITANEEQLQQQQTNLTTTPVTLKNAILTPPSSEQLSTGQTFEAMCGAQNPTGALGATCASGVDSFLTEENLKHLRKNSSYLECGNSLCRQENLREHFHCFEEPCQGKILSKKDDIIRHLKWHKKRKESLLLGFARFSSSDDCAPEYGAGCAHNWKQTHYHCIYEDCPKVYVSTSDVQMHANFHRKNSEIVQEGFRRFRAHENCKIEECPFYGKKTSHYHCCREGCNHTFKNKADMDKHKTYHMKDHQLIQDGFKKILKTEQCPFEDCKFSTVSNHIHCVREGCNFILHSSTQMISHKRKHDRAEGEQNYQQFKSQRDSSEEESPKPVIKAAAIKPERRTSSSSSTSTPLSSLSAEHFLARKRGRPPKKIQLSSESQDTKRIKLETTAASKTSTYVPPKAATLSMINPFMPGYQNPTATDPNAAPNLQLTHLMALFQLQNPLFYQNLYPAGRAATNMANILDNTAESGSTSPATTNASSTNLKQDFSDKSEFKE
ncbi:Transcription factor castor, partial [Lucilia cuprina]